MKNYPTSDDPPAKVCSVLNIVLLFSSLLHGEHYLLLIFVKNTKDAKINPSYCTALNMHLPTTNGL
jgi:hypothetical protein